jgi:hypothetical protein
MASVVIAGDVSGTCTLQAANAAGTTVLTLPTTSGTLVSTTTPLNASSITSGTLAVAYGGTGVGTSTGTGNVVLSTSPTLVTPVLGTPSSGNLASCTGYSASNLATGTLPAARLPAGSVLQVVQTYKTDSFSTSSTSYTNVTGLSASITPTSATSKILVMVSVFIDGYQNQNFIALTRNGTLVGQSTAGSTLNSLANAWGQNSGSDGETLVANYLDSPATTSALTYQVQAARQNSGSSPLLINVVVNGTYGGVSSITLMEIAA